MDNNIKFCPYCNANLQGEPIPKDLLKHYGNFLLVSKKNRNF